MATPCHRIAGFLIIIHSRDKDSRALQFTGTYGGVHSVYRVHAGLHPRSPVFVRRGAEGDELEATFTIQYFLHDPCCSRAMAAEENKTGAAENLKLE